MSGRAADQTDRGRQASQNHHGRQKHRTAITEKKFGTQSKNRSTGFLNADRAHALRTDLRNEDVDNAEHRSGNQRGLEHFACNVGLLGKAGITDDPNGERREDQRGNSVERVITIKDSLDNSHHGSRVGSGRCLRFAHRSDEALDNKDHQRQNQQRRQDLADTINKLGRRRSKPSGYAQKDSQKDRHADFELRRLKERNNSNFPGDRTGTRNSKAGTNGQNADCGIENAEPRMDAVADFT